MLSGIIRCFFSPYTQQNAGWWNWASLVFANDCDRENAIHHSKQSEEAVSHSVQPGNWELKCGHGFPVQPSFCLDDACMFIFRRSWCYAELACSYWRLSANLLSASSAAPKIEILHTIHLFGQGVYSRHFSRQVVRGLINLWGQKHVEFSARASGEIESRKISLSRADGKICGRMIEWMLPCLRFTLIYTLFAE